MYLDTIGIPPTLEEVSAFMSSVDPGKRARVIDNLLNRPERADFWAMRFADMFRAGYNEAGQKGGGRTLVGSATKFAGTYLTTRWFASFW